MHSSDELGQLRPGDVLAGRYYIVDLLDESRGGRFWRAEDKILARPVALHVIPDDDERGDGLLEAARLSATVQDPCILRVLDADCVDGVCFVVNEWGSGASLDVLLARDGPLPPRRAAWIVAEVAAMVAAAHEAGVAHGRLCPETVMIDQHGAVRIIGLAVEAALWGLPPGRMSTDITDLGALLYAGLTARWAGESLSKVPAAHEVAGRVLRPRKVRAGIPRLLDSMCDEILNITPIGHHARSAYDLTTGDGIAEALSEFVGDPAGLMIPEPERLMATIVPPSDDDPLGAGAADHGELDTGSEATVTLALVPPDDPEPQDVGGATHEARSPLDAEPAAERTTPLAREPTTQASSTAASSGSSTSAPTGPSTGAPTEAIPAWEEGAPNSGDLPTQAGLPVFDDDNDEVSWLSTHAEKPSPPPSFTEAPTRPLFAPEPADGRPVRTPRPGVQAAPAPEYWPWEGTGTGPGGSRTATGTQPGVHTTSSGIGIFDDFELDEEVPGRSWLRLAAVLAAGMVLLLAVVFAVNLGQGRSVLQFDDDVDPGAAGDATTVVVTDTTARDLDPQGEDREEFPDLVGFVVDGQPNTAWRSQTYNQQFGPAGLKTGVGVVVDLGASTDVRRVSVDLVGAPTGVSIFLTEDQPADVAGLKPISKRTTDGRLDVETEETGRYVIVWLTSLPAVDSGFRGSIAEVEVRQARS